MLFPDIVQFPVSEVPVLQEIMEDLSYLGFELTDLGGGSYAINGIPSGIEGLNPVELIQSMDGVEAIFITDDEKVHKIGI